MAALSRAGFDAVSLAGNHIADCGAAGIIDTIRALDGADVSYRCRPDTGRRRGSLQCSTAGSNRIALLSYNCVGPAGAWATDDRAGCSYICVWPADGGPIAPAAPSTRRIRRRWTTMACDIPQAGPVPMSSLSPFTRASFTRARASHPMSVPWRTQPSMRAADIVLGHHAHIIRGIEIYRGKPIFHGLGNGCVVTRALSPDQDHPARAAWARRRRELFGFEPDPAYPLAPFHPEAVNALLGRVRVRDGRLRVGLRL